jgi:phosphatidylserine/phosphatidylglycerophosphate/cardiolipin synthase-like enzyme
MHAKSVVVDRRWWFVTSANFTRRGHERNIGVGTLIEDPALFSALDAVGADWPLMGGPPTPR